MKINLYNVMSTELSPISLSSSSSSIPATPEPRLPVVIRPLNIMNPPQQENAKKRRAEVLAPYEITFHRDEIPKSESLADEEFDKQFETLARRFGSRLGIPSEQLNVPFDLLVKSVNKTVRDSIVKVPDTSPMKDTKLVIFKDDYAGEIPLNGIKQSNFNVLEGFYNRIIGNQTIIRIAGSPHFRNKILKLIRKILANEVGREFLNRLCKNESKKLTIKPKTPTFQVTTTVSNETLSEVTIYFSFDPTMVSRRNRKGQLSPAEAPFDTILFHEMIHAENMFKAPNMTEFNKRVLRKPVHDRDFSNCEEECTIGYIEKESANPHAWKKRSSKGICENDLRMSHENKLPIRFGHTGINLPPEDFDPKDEETIDYFYQCCREGYETEVKGLLALGVKPDDVSCPEVQETPLFVAAQKGRLAVMLALLQKGANANFVTTHGLTLAHYCVESGDVSMMIYLTSHNIINIANSDRGQIPLIAYAINKLGENCCDMVEFLLRQGAQFHRLLPDYSTALHEAAVIKNTVVFDKLNTLNHLLNRALPFEILEKNAAELTPLHIAFMNGNLDLIKHLFKIEFLYHTVFGRNWMCYAAQSNDIPTVEFILSFNREYFLKDYPGPTIIDFAFEGTEKDVVKRRNFIQYLLDLGFKLQPHHFENYMSLYATASQDVREKIILQVYTIASINAPLCYGLPLLEWAVSESDADLALSALMRRAHVNPVVTRENPETPLHIAIKRNDRPMVELLLQWGADKHAKNFKGQSAIELMMEKLNKDSSFDNEIFELLTIEPKIYQHIAKKIAFTPSTEELFKQTYGGISPTPSADKIAVPRNISSDSANPS